jgi:hypothetical protein
MGHPFSMIGKSPSDHATLQGAPFKLRGLAQPNFLSYSSGWRRGPLKVPTLNFAKCAKFRMGHPVSMIGKSPSDLATLQGAPLKLRLGEVFANAGGLGQPNFLSTLRGGGVADLTSPP